MKTVTSVNNAIARIVQEDTDIHVDAQIDAIVARLARRNSELRAALKNFISDLTPR